MSIQAGAPPPQQDPFLSFSHSFSLKSVHVRGWRPPPQREILDPPLKHTILIKCGENYTNTFRVEQEHNFEDNSDMNYEYVPHAVFLKYYIKTSISRAGYRMSSVHYEGWGWSMCKKPHFRI